MRAEKVPTGLGDRALLGGADRGVLGGPVGEARWGWLVVNRSVDTALWTSGSGQRLSHPRAAGTGQRDTKKGKSKSPSLEMPTLVCARYCYK